MLETRNGQPQTRLGKQRKGKLSDPDLTHVSPPFTYQTRIDVDNWSSLLGERKRAQNAKAPQPTQPQPAKRMPLAPPLDYFAHPPKTMKRSYSFFFESFHPTSHLNQWKSPHNQLQKFLKRFFQPSRAKCRLEAEQRKAANNAFRI